jgi:hypothetical protein
MSLTKPYSNIGKAHSIGAVLAILGGLFLSLIEVGFIRSWSNDRWMNLPCVISVIATVLLFLSLLPFADLSKLRMRILCSGLLVFSVAYFLIEIISIATGNNDSGEVFWIVVLPAILLFTYLYFSYLKLTKLNVLR